MKREITELYLGDCHCRYVIRYKKHWWSRWHYMMDGKYPRLFTKDELKTMERERNKPTQSWIERTKYELEHEEELSIERAYELGKIRGKKEQEAIDDNHFREATQKVIDKASEVYEKKLRELKRILNDKYGAGDIISIGGSLIDFRKAVEE